MNGLHQTKSKIQIYLERVVKCSVVMFLVGVLCGIGISNSIHKYEKATVETSIVKEVITPMPTPTATPTPIPTAKPTTKPAMKLKATKTPAPIITVTPVPTKEIAVTENTEGLRSLGTFRLSAYCACYKCCGKYANGITASGKTARANHTIAADTSVLPFGTEVYIEGQKYVVEDRGGAIKGNRIDIYFDSHTEANNFGVKYKEIFIG